jgi:tetratricopeptide (TPR) repeat protein
LYAELGEHERAATCLHNRGFVALQAGDPLRALELFDAAVGAGLRVSMRAEALIDRAYALLAAGLVVPAGEALNRAAILLGGAGRSMRLAEAMLAYGQCAARAGRRQLALEAADTARALFRAQRRAGWEAAAEALELRLTITPATVPAARAMARRCVRYGFRVEAAELRLAAGNRDLLRLVEAERARGSAHLRALGWLARARLAGHRRAALAACRAGLRTGAVEVADELISTGLAAVLEDPAAVLRWVAGVPLTGLIESLGSRALLHYVEHAGELLAVSLVDGRARVHRLGAARIDVEGLRFALATTDGNACGVEAVLLAPLRRVLADRELVVVPSAGMQGMPWAALDTCAGRPVSVVPAVRAWLRASEVELRFDSAVWVAGPGLRHADREVAELQHRWGGSVLYSGESTVDAVLASMDGADLVHIAAHGRYRVGVELADGVLRIDNIGRLLRPPSMLVLSACECAATPLLYKGGRAVIASALPVVDEAAVGLLATLHEYLRAGCGPAEAVMRLGDRGFVCLGAG